MQIFVDADACPVVAIIEKIAKDNSVPVMCCVIQTMFCHRLIVKLLLSVQEQMQ